MNTMASQITSLRIVYSKRLFRRRSKKTSKPVTGESPYKGPVTWKMIPFDDVIMIMIITSLMESVPGVFLLSIV